MDLSVNESENVKPKTYELDRIIIELGSFGRFQILILSMIGITTILSGTFAISFVFTVGDLNYRCSVEQCDNQTSEYITGWLPNAVPYNGEKPKSCSRYKFLQFTDDSQRCYSPGDFDQSVVETCNSDFVWEDDESTIVREFNLTCDENKWKIPLVGTLHYAGYFFNLLISGYFSDRYGRKLVFILTILSCGTFGIIRSFTTSYISFIVIEFIDALLGGAGYGAAYIMVVENLRPEHRAAGGTILFIFTSIGKALVGVTAMWYRDWKLLLQINSIPACLAIAYFWLLPESVRWLLSQNRHKDAAKILLKAHKMNNHILSQDTVDMLENRCEQITSGVTKPPEQVEQTPGGNAIKEIFKYPAMMWRIVICSFCWFTNVFVFYELSLGAVAIGGNKFSDFTVVSLIEVPAAVLVVFIINKYGRKKLLCGSLLLSGVVLLISIVTPVVYWLQLLIFLIGKFAITLAFCTIYIYTSELFPTNLRHTLLGICSAFGRIGSVIAPQAPLLEDMMKGLPMILFGGTALIAGVLTLTFPETLNTRMPDTIVDALDIGKSESSKFAKAKRSYSNL